MTITERYEQLLARWDKLFQKAHQAQMEQRRGDWTAASEAMDDVIEELDALKASVVSAFLLALRWSMTLAPDHLAAMLKEILYAPRV